MKRSAFHADFTLALRSAIASALIHGRDSGKAVRALAKHTEAPAAELGLLGPVALYRFLDAAFRDKVVAERNRELLERVAGLLRLWTGQEKAEVAGIGPEAKRKVVQLCVRVFEWLVGKDGLGDGDEGYDTMG